jgi:hypothetical protein
LLETFSILYAIEPVILSEGICPASTFLRLHLSDEAVGDCADCAATQMDPDMGSNCGQSIV